MPGPRPEPLEKKRLKGRSADRDSGGRKLPEPGSLVALPGGADALPAVPSSLVAGGPGEECWNRLWSQAGAWLSTATDYNLLVRLCEAQDLRAAMRDALAESGFFVTGSMGQQRPNPLIDKLRALDAAVLAMEKECGFTPSSRGSMGVGEVSEQTVSKLDALLQKAAARGGRRQA